MREHVQNLINSLSPLSWEERLSALGVHENVVFSTSFSYEDQAITHAIAIQKLPVRVFTLDTGRLFEQTHETFQNTCAAYPDLKIETYYPETQAVQTLIAQQGTNGFYDS